MTTIAAREAAARINEDLSPALAKEKQQEREREERRRMRGAIEKRKNELTQFYLERQKKWMREEAFDPKFNFPDVHGKPKDSASRGWKRDQEQRHMPTDDATQLRSHVCVYKFKKNKFSNREASAQDDEGQDSEEISLSSMSSASPRTLPTGGKTPDTARRKPRNRRRRKNRSSDRRSDASEDDDGGGNLKDGKMLAKASSKIGLMRPTILGPLRKYRIVNLSAGMHHVLFVTHQGRVLSMGGGRAGQLGQGKHVEHSAKPALVATGDMAASDFVEQVSAGASHSMVITRKELGKSKNGQPKTINKVFSFGDNSRGQLGLGCSSDSQKTVSVPRLVARGLGKRTKAKPFEPNRIYCQKLSLGAHHSVALADGGIVFTWGGNQYGQLGDGGNFDIKWMPSMVTALRQQCIVDIAAGDMHTVVVTNAGDIWSWGRGSEGQLGHGTLSHENMPRLLNLGGDFFKSVTAGRFHTLCTTTSGHVRSFGKNTAGVLGNGNTDPLPDPGGMRINGRIIDKRFACTYYKDRAVSSDDDKVAENAMINPSLKPMMQVITLPKIKDSSKGGAPHRAEQGIKKNKTCSEAPILSSETLYCPRMLAVSDIGPNIVEDRDAITAAILHRAHHQNKSRDFEIDEDYIKEVSAGAQHSVALTKRGLVYTFGYAGGNGRLGHGDAISRPLPKHVTVLQDDAKDADMWRKRNLIERLVEVEKQHTPVIKAESADPKDVDRALAANRVSDELCREIDGLEDQAKIDNFAFECMRAFRYVDKRGRGEVSYKKVRPALNQMRISLRSPTNPISCCRISVDALCDAADEEERGVVTETPFIDYLVNKHVSRKKGIPRKKYTKMWRMYKKCRGRLADLRPDPDGRSTFINALEDMFIDTSLELGELVSKEQCRLMFEYEILPDFNDDGSKVKKVDYARDKLPDEDAKLGVKMDLEARENNLDGEKKKKKKKKKKSEIKAKGNWKKLRNAVKAGQAFEDSIRANNAKSDSGRPKKPTQAEEADLLGLAEEQKNRDALVSPKTTKKKGEQEPEVSQPELLYGVLNLRGLGLTDKHVNALAIALRTVPAVQTIDLRQNFISDEGVSLLLETMHFHHELAQYDSTQTLCGKCNSVLNFTDAARQAVFCIDCKSAQWRPAYLLSKVIVRENEEYVTPKRMLKWYEVDYDRNACNILARRLNEDRENSLTRHQYTELHESILDEHAAKFVSEAMDMVDKIMPPRKARKKKRFREERERLIEEVEELEKVLHTYGRRMFNGKHVPRYGLVAVAEIQRISAEIRKDLIEAVYRFFHAHVPLDNNRLLEGVQAAHLVCAERVDKIKWECREMKVRVHEILYSLAAELYEHYLILNAGATVYQTATGHNCTYLLTREGTVLSMGSSTNIIDSFKEQIVTRLPDRFRANIEKGRDAARVAAANEGRKRALTVSETKSGSNLDEGEHNDTSLALSYDASPLALPSKSFEAFDMTDMHQRFKPPPHPGDNNYVDDEAEVAKSHKIHEDSWIDQRYHEDIGPEDHEIQQEGELEGIERVPLLLHGPQVQKSQEAEPSVTVANSSVVSTVDAETTEEEVIAQAFVGDHYMQGRFRPGTATEQILQMRERANNLIAEQNALIEASLGQDKVREYKRIAAQMQEDKRIAESEKAKKTRHLLWNLDLILAQDARQRNIREKYQQQQQVSQSNSRRRRLMQSRTAGIEPHTVKDLFILFPGANKRFVEALFEANGGVDGISQTVNVLADLKEDGVFEAGWDPEEDAEVQDAMMASKGGVFDISTFDV